MKASTLPIVDFFLMGLGFRSKGAGSASIAAGNVLEIIKVVSLLHGVNVAMWFKCAQMCCRSALGKSLGCRTDKARMGRN